jgi:hypothetical protein
MLPGIADRIESLEWRIDKFKRQNPDDPRHEWRAKDVAYQRRLMPQVRAEISVFRRLATRPWEPIPSNPRFGLMELSPDDRKLIEPGPVDRIGFPLAFALGAALLVGSLVGRHLQRG